MNAELSQVLADYRHSESCKAKSLRPTPERSIRDVVTSIISQLNTALRPSSLTVKTYHRGAYQSSRRGRSYFCVDLFKGELISKPDAKPLSRLGSLHITWTKANEGVFDLYFAPEVGTLQELHEELRVDQILANDASPSLNLNKKNILLKDVEERLNRKLEKTICYALKRILGIGKDELLKNTHQPKKDRKEPRAGEFPDPGPPLSL